METRSADKLGPFVVLTFIYFIVGFLTTVNGQCQGPLKIAFLADAGALKNTFVTLISFFFFLGYLICSPFGGRWINRVGYKRTLLRSLGFMIAGLAMFWASSWFTVTFPAAVVGIGAAHVPGGYFIFLTGSFLMGTAAALSQVVINPYISAYELPGTQSVQRMNIVCAINSFGTMIAPFFVTTLIFGGRAIEEVEVRQLMTPFLILAVFVVITALTKLYKGDQVFDSYGRKDNRRICRTLGRQRGNIWSAVSGHSGISRSAWSRSSSMWERRWRSARTSICMRWRWAATAKR